MIPSEGGVVISVEPSPTTSTETFIFHEKYYNDRLDMPKQCSKCGKVKPLSEFGTANATKKDGYNSWCKQCVRESSKTFRETASGIYSAIKGRQKFYIGKNDNKTKPVTITRKEFCDWYDNEPRVCAYCDIPEDLIDSIEDNYNKQSERLSIDCMNNDSGYAKNNLVLACRRCNSIKSDLLSYEEMREFAQKYIKPKWENKLQPTIIKENDEND